jgi:hypothetical protein
LGFEIGDGWFNTARDGFGAGIAHGSRQRVNPLTEGEKLIGFDYWRPVYSRPNDLFSLIALSLSATVIFYVGFCLVLFRKIKNWQ